MNTIKKITSSALCTACGTCVALCPQKAIKMKSNHAGYLCAEIDDAVCVDCGLCLSFCQSNRDNIINSAPQDIFHGIFISGYVGYAADPDIRQKSQSGGVVTALLCYLLDNGIIDGAVVNSFNEETIRPIASFADTREKIIEGCGSYYAQTAVVDECLKHQQQNTAAVVLGCQAESLQLLREKKQNIKLPDYIIGLVCAGQNSGYMIDNLIRSSNLDSSNETVKQFRFRDKRYGGWPGSVHIETDKCDYSLPTKARMDLKPLYEAFRCLLCYDQMNIFSDIVCGDPWGISEKKQPEGHTVIVARTEKGLTLIENAEKAGYIVIEPLDIERIFRGQTVDNRHINKFYTCKNICEANNWYYPYNKMFITKNDYDKETKKYKKRLKYTRQYYLAEDQNTAMKILKAKKNRIMAKATLTKPYYFAIRVGSKIFKLLRNKK